MEPLSGVLTVQLGSPSTGRIAWPNTCAWVAAGLARRGLRRLCRQCQRTRWSSTTGTRSRWCAT